MAEGIFGNLSSSSEKSAIGNGEKGPSDFLKLFYELTGKKKSHNNSILFLFWCFSQRLLELIKVRLMLVVSAVGIY